MKKVIAITAVMFAMTNSYFAQENNEDFSDKLMVGFKGGLNLSNVYDSEGEEFDADSKLGYAFGAFVAIPVGKRFGIQPEFLISQKGFQATGYMFGSQYSFTRTTTYVDLPILFAIKPVEFLTIVLGPQYSYLIKQRDVYTNGVTTYEQETEFENDNLRKNTLCFTAGADVNVNHLVFGARVGWDLLNNNGNGTTSTPRYKNVWYQATVGFRF